MEKGTVCEDWLRNAGPGTLFSNLYETKVKNDPKATMYLGETSSPSAAVDAVMVDYASNGYAVMTFREMADPCRLVQGPKIYSYLGFAVRYIKCSKDGGCPISFVNYRPNFSLLPMLNYHLHQMHRSGLLDSFHHRNRMYDKPSDHGGEGCDEGSLEGLGYEAIATAFMVLMAGAGAAVLSAVSERLHIGFEESI